jgi:plasmid maintenance system antidote protein VapI
MEDKTVEGMLPGEFVKREIKRKGMQIKDVARIAGVSYPNLSKILNDKMDMTLEMAMVLAYTLGMDPEKLAVLVAKNYARRWENKPNYVGHHSKDEIIKMVTLHDKYHIKNLVALGMLKDTGNLKLLEDNLTRIYQIPSKDQLYETGKTELHNKHYKLDVLLSEYFSARTQQLIEAKKEELQVPPFDICKLKEVVSSIPALLNRSDWVNHLIESIIDCGVIFVNFRSANRIGLKTMYSLYKMINRATPVAMFISRQRSIEDYLFSIVRLLCYIIELKNNKQMYCSINGSFLDYGVEPKGELEISVCLEIRKLLLYGEIEEAYRKNNSNIEETIKALPNVPEVIIVLSFLPFADNNREAYETEACVYVAV